MLAEKVETDEDIAWAMAPGFDLFQGYAIERPALVTRPAVQTSALAYVQLAVTLLAEELDLEEIEEVLRREPALVVQVLQMASIGNRHGLRRQVRSVHEALVLMRRWCCRRRRRRIARSAAAEASLSRRRTTPRARRASPVESRAWMAWARTSGSIEWRQRQMRPLASGAPRRASAVSSRATIPSARWLSTTPRYDATLTAGACASTALPRLRDAARATSRSPTR